MADWYVSSAANAAIPQWAATTVYTVGQFVRALATPGQQYSHFVHRCTTAGTSGASEPSWNTSNNGTTTSGSAVFTNVTGQSAYGWSAAAANTYSLSWAGFPRVAAGDRVFVSSDHSETLTSATYLAFSTTGGGYGQVQVISVNRAGSVPPVEADLLKGAAITFSSGTYLDALHDTYWEGITLAWSGLTHAYLNNSGIGKTHYFKNCTIALTGGGSSNRITINGTVRLILDGTDVSFSHASQGITVGSYALDMVWMNKAPAVIGTIPTTLFIGGGTATMSIVCRGLDLTNITGNLLIQSTGTWGFSKLLLDSCKIAAGVVRLTVPSPGQADVDEIELINCHDGVNVVNERHGSAGIAASDYGLSMDGGAQDDIGHYSLKLVSSPRAGPQVLPLAAFWLDVENTVIGASKTATVEIISNSALNNTDIRLLLEYMGTSGNPIASFADGVSSVLAVPAALPNSTLTWSGSPGVNFNLLDSTNVALSGNNLIATITSALSSGVRTGIGLTAGKIYFEMTFSVWAGSNTAINLSQAGIAFNSAINVAWTNKTGGIYINNSLQGPGLGARAAGDTIGCAVDLTAQLIWFRVCPSGNWNGSGTANPATGAGGFSISALTGPLYPMFSGSTVGDSATANFGATAYVGAAPSGFASGFTPTAKQKLQATFTAQRAGRLRGQVLLGKISTSVWVNPQLAIA